VIRAFCRQGAFEKRLQDAINKECVSSPASLRNAPADKQQAYILTVRRNRGKTGVIADSSLPSKDGSAYDSTSSQTCWSWSVRRPINRRTVAYKTADRHLRVCIPQYGRPCQVWRRPNIHHVRRHSVRKPGQPICARRAGDVKRVKYTLPRSRSEQRGKDLALYQAPSGDRLSFADRPC
jgi:hypothetical protein